MGENMTPQRIQLSRKKGFNLQEFSRKLNGLPAVICARPHYWGNKFKVSNILCRLQTLQEEFNRKFNPPYESTFILGEGNRRRKALAPAGSKAKRA